MELLSPGGSFAAACAALHYGADAVYVGLQRFSARAAASNLTAEELVALATHAHALTPRRAVYLALNTLVTDRQLPEVLATLETAADAGVDAVILQDLAVCRLMRKLFPTLPLHASTQMGIHNLSGVKALADMGFRRVVLARELTLREIEWIAAESRIELEVFVHGALCYAYSGHCLFSALERGRSGNRGLCAYCCREPFACDNNPESSYVFSMRDLALWRQLNALSRAGVTSVKIEGRMKSPLYVAVATDLYRRRLDRSLTPRDEAERVAALRSVFSRAWTGLYLAGRNNRQGHIDSHVTGHLGAPIGTLEALRRDRRGGDGCNSRAIFPSKSMMACNGCGRTVACSDLPWNACEPARERLGCLRGPRTALSKSPCHPMRRTSIRVLYCFARLHRRCNDGTSCRCHPPHNAGQHAPLRFMRGCLGRASH